MSNFWFTEDVARLLNGLEATAEHMADEHELAGYRKCLEAVRLSFGLLEPRTPARTLPHIRRTIDAVTRTLPVLVLLVLPVLVGGCAEADAPDSPRAMATASALSQRVELEASAHERDMVQAAAWSWLAFGVQAALLVGLGGLGLGVLWNVELHVARRLRLREARLELEANVIETRQGTMRTAAAHVVPVLAASNVPDLLEASDAGSADELQPDTFTLHSKGHAEVLLKAVEARPEAVRLACRLVRLSMVANGPASNRLATWRQLQLSSDTWTRAVRLLGQHVETRAGRNGGTRLREGTLASFYSALASGRVALEDVRRH